MANARSVFLAVIKGDASQAVTEFENLGKSVEKSTGKSATAMDKFKSLGKSAFNELKENAVASASAAASAYAAFAMSAAQEFTRLAKSAGDLSRATGLTIEQSSQWIEVAGDFGVEADTLQGAIGRLNKNLDTGKFEKYGIATRDAAGKVLSSQEIFLNVLDAMNRTPDAGMRARMGAELMGKGWQGLAPILGKSRAEYEDLLATVSSGQTITAEESKQAREFIAIQQDLADAYANYRLEVGKSVLPIVKLGDNIRQLTSDFEGLDDSVAGSVIFGQFGNVLAEGIKQIVNPLRSLSQKAEYLNGLFGEDVPEAVGVTAGSLEELGSSYIVGGINVLSDEVYKVGDAAGVASDNVLDLKSYFVDLLATLDEERSLLKLQDSFDEVRQKAVDAFNAAVKGLGDAEEKQRAYRLSVLDLRDEVIRYSDAVGDIPPEVVSQIDALINQSKYDEAEALLNRLARFREATIGVRTLIGGRMNDGGVSDFLFGQFNADVPGRAIGGPVSGGSPYLVGERGPELFVPGMSGSIVPNHALGGNVTLNVVVNQPVASGEQLANELAAYTRRNGSRWLVPA